MAIIKKFRIKSFKQKKPILKLENVSLSFGKRQILENVKAFILLQNSEIILIESNYAKYNTKSYDTLFNDSVSVDYGDHVLKSEFLDLSFENNLVSVYDNVRYLSGISSLRADKAEIDILNKKTKIFMEDPNKKVQINNSPKNGNN